MIYTRCIEGRGKGKITSLDLLARLLWKLLDKYLATA